MHRDFVARLAAAAMLTVPALGWTQPSPPSVERAMGGDHFAVGGFVRVDQPVQGDLIAAGGSIRVDAPVEGDAIVAGGEVRLHGPVGASLYAAGGRVSLNARVGRNVRVGGGQVDFERDAAVDGNVTVGGGEVTLNAPVKGYVQAAGGRVFIDAPVGGDVVSTAGSIELGPNARIDGRLRYASREAPVLDPAARVAAGIERIEWPRGKAIEQQAGSIARGGGWAWSLGLVLLAAVLAAALPAPVDRIASTLRQRAPLSLLIGFIGLVCIPAAALILMITVIGIPAALVIVTAYLALLLLGYVSVGATLGMLALDEWASAKRVHPVWRGVAAAAGMLLLTLLARVPFVGGLIVLLALLVGLGALLMQAARLRKPPDAPPAGAAR